MHHNSMGARRGARHQPGVPLPRLLCHCNVCLQPAQAMVPALGLAACEHEPRGCACAGGWRGRGTSGARSARCARWQSRARPRASWRRWARRRAAGATRPACASCCAHPRCAGSSRSVRRIRRLIAWSSLLPSAHSRRVWTSAAACVFCTARRTAGLDKYAAQATNPGMARVFACLLRNAMRTADAKIFVQNTAKLRWAACVCRRGAAGAAAVCRHQHGHVLHARDPGAGGRARPAAAAAHRARAGRRQRAGHRRRHAGHRPLRAQVLPGMSPEPRRSLARCCSLRSPFHFQLLTGTEMPHDS